MHNHNHNHIPPSPPSSSLTSLIPLIPFTPSHGTPPACAWWGGGVGKTQKTSSGTSESHMNMVRVV